MSKNVTKTAIAIVPSLSAEDIRSKVTAMLASNPELAAALAANVLVGNTRKARNASPAKSQETEAERANRCAQFDDYSARGKIVAFAIGKLGNDNVVSLSENDIAEAIGLPVYKVRPALSIIEARLSDLHNDKFPLVAQCGYVASIEGERNEAKTLHFSRVVAVEKPVKTPRKSRKAIASPDIEKPANDVPNAS